MKKNRLKLFKNEPKRPKKSAQLEKNNFPTGKQKFSNWKIIFSQLSFANFPTAFRIENENVNIFFGHMEYVGVTSIPLRGRTRRSDLFHMLIKTLRAFKPKAIHVSVLADSLEL